MDVFEQIAALRREGRPFAVATVVGRRAPVSAHLGDRAIVFADGRMEGFVGGACSREIIRSQALEAMRSRCGRLVSIRPDAADAPAASGEHVVVPMTCASEGAADIFVEPFVAPARLVIVGVTPIAAALARLARGMDYDVFRAVDAGERRDIEQEAAALGIAVVSLETLDDVLRERGEDQAVVVASQGHYDEEALETSLKHAPGYVGLVASRRRGAAVRGLVKESGATGTEAVHNPAGLDLGARTPPEVALSILAEIVKVRLKPDAPVVSGSSRTAGETTARDPVCGMDVDIASARQRAVVDGATYYFCCATCRAQFLKNPARYAAGPA